MPNMMSWLKAFDWMIPSFGAAAFVIVLLIIGGTAALVVKLPLKLLDAISIWKDRKAQAAWKKRHSLADKPRAGGLNIPGIWIPGSTTAIPAAPEAPASRKEDLRMAYQDYKDTVVRRLAVLCIRAKVDGPRGTDTSPLDPEAWNKVVNAWGTKERLAQLSLIEPDGSSDMGDATMGPAGALQAAAREIANAMADLPYEEIVLKLNQDKVAQVASGWARRLVQETRFK